MFSARALLLPPPRLLQLPLLPPLLRSALGARALHVRAFDRAPCLVAVAAAGPPWQAMVPEGRSPWGASVRVPPELTRVFPPAVQAGALHNLEAFASFNGPDFYGLPRNTGATKNDPAPPRLAARPCRTSAAPASMQRPAGRLACPAARRPSAARTPLAPTAPPTRTPSRRRSPAADKVTLRRQRWKVPDSYEFGDSVVVPMWAGQECPWTVVA